MHDPASSAALVVVKVGGSLLSFPELPERLQAVLRHVGDANPLILCGGGESADVVRRWQPVHGLTDEQAHWLALRAVDLNELLLSILLPRAVIVASREEMKSAWMTNRPPILAMESFLRREEAAATAALPHDWSATSDSIAAWVARALNAERLILMKSCDLPIGVASAAAAEQGLVDEHFSAAAKGLRVEWVNLRSDSLRFLCSFL